MDRIILKENIRYSLWQLLSQYTIVIPKIQRDYAQGRSGKTELRRNFLRDIHDALTNPDGKGLKLDFVYGTMNDSKAFLPLDGQQRLTTLWLIHWYIALKIGHFAQENSSDIVRNTLHQFTYQTRSSSEDFCNALCNNNFERDIPNIVPYIKSQTWFFSEWLQDPTVQAMLRMLEGTERNKDGIEQVFEKDNYEQLWDLLTRESPVYFYTLNLSHFNLTDDLYIKMNARGKALSSFENFKADLIGFIASKKDDKKWEALYDAENGFPIKADTTWAQIFWQANTDFWKQEEENNPTKDIEYRIDAPYFAFLNRAFFNHLIIERKKIVQSDAEEEDAAYLYSATNLDNDKNPYLVYLYGPKIKDNAHDEQIEYNSFDKYCYYPESDETSTIPFCVFENLEKILDNLNITNDTLTSCFPERHKSESFEFIPIYRKIEEDKYNIPSISLKNRVVFFAVYAYLAKGAFIEESFRQWMRVVWNIIDESEIDSVSSMITRIRRVHRLTDGSHNIYQFLSKLSLTEKDNAQLVEEQIKAIAIIYNKLGLDTEKKLLDAENNVFNTGCIRCLYQGSDGKEDWRNYIEKWNYFKSNFTISLEKSTDANLMKQLFKYMNETDFVNTLWWWYKVFNNRISSWHHFLRNDNLHHVLHSFLLQEQVPDHSSYGIQSPIGHKYCLYHLAYGELLDYVMEKIPYSWIRDKYHAHYAIFPSGTGIFINSTKRNHFLLNTSDVEIIDKKTANGADDVVFLFGNSINFTYKGCLLQWYDWDSCIYKIDEQGQRRLKGKIDTKELSEQDIISHLDDLIKESATMMSEIQ